MKSSLSDIKTSLALHLAFFIFGATLLFSFSKYDLFLMINKKNNSFFDVFFYHATRLPEIAWIIFVFFLSLFYNKKYFLMAVICLILCISTVTIIKYLILPNYARPFSWLSQNNIPFHQVPKIKFHLQSGFPSGHTLSAFACLGLVGFMSKNGFVQFLFFILALISGYSRVYVGQHFYTDVYAGAFLGYLIVLLIYLLLNKKLNSPYWEKRHLS